MEPWRSRDPGHLTLRKIATDGVTGGKTYFFGSENVCNDHRCNISTVCVRVCVSVCVRPHLELGGEETTEVSTSAGVEPRAFLGVALLVKVDVEYS